MANARKDHPRLFLVQIKKCLQDVINSEKVSLIDRGKTSLVVIVARVTVGLLHTVIGIDMGEKTINFFP